MKKLFLVVVAAFLSMSLAMPVFAKTGQHKKSAPAMEITRGAVVSVDTANKQMVVKDEKSNQDRTFTVSEKAALGLRVGEMVKVKSKAGSNVAESVKVGK